MKDCLKGLSLDHVREDNGAKCGALQGAGVIEDGGAEMVAYGAKDGWIGCGQAAGAGVGVKDAKRRVKRGETTGEECLACGYPARDTENWHAE